MTLRILMWKSERDELGRIAAASFICPQCGNRTWTGTHQIKDDGKIIPAVECDHSCGFRDHVQLAGWCWGALPKGG